HGGGRHLDGPELGSLPGQCRCSSACDRRGRLGRVAAVAVERELDRRGDRAADRYAVLRLEVLEVRASHMADENLYQYFKIEARELVADLSRDILGLEKQRGAGLELLPRLLRQAHTLKGAARVVRLPRIAEIAHAMEDALTSHRDSRDAVTAEQIGQLLQQVDIISSEIRALDPAPPTDAQSPLSAVEPFERVRVGLAEMDALLSGV